jgi:hypothetical protein
MADVANVGTLPIDGSLRVDASFHQKEQPVDIEPYESLLIYTGVDLTTAEPGTHPVTLTLVAGNGVSLASTGITITVPGPEFAITSVSEEVDVRAGEWVTLTFGLENRGSAPGMAVITATVGDLMSGPRGVWLASDESGTIEFSFLAPDSLPTGELVCTYWFEGQRYDFILYVVGVEIDVEAGFEQATYVVGDTALLQIGVANENDAPTPPMYVHVAYQGQVYTRSLTLAGDESVTFDFALTAAAGDPKVFYALYEEGEERGVYLNTTYLYLRYPDATLVPDSHVYQPGDTVHVTVQTDATGVLVVSAPGFTTTLHLSGNDTSFQFTLPDALMRGTHAIDYALDGGSPRRVLFDVDAPWVRVTEARLLDTPVVPGDDVQVDLTIASTHELDAGIRAWLVYPDGTQSEEVFRVIQLDEVLNNHIAVALPLSTTQAGLHRLVYLVTDADDVERVYAMGSEAFDVGTVVALGLYTDRREYAYTNEPVTATTTILSDGETSARVDWQLDGVSVMSQVVELEHDIQELTLSLAELPGPGEHILQVEVMAGGMSSIASATFIYGTDAADIVVARPYLSELSGGTAAIRTYVYNRGKEPAAPSTLRLYSGDPATEGELIAEVAVPALPAKDSSYQHVEEFLIDWEVTGLAGSHTLCAVADTDDTVQEIDEVNNVSLADTEIPSLSLIASTDKQAYERSEPVDIAIQAHNLQLSGTLHITLTTTADLLGFQPFQSVESLAIPAGTVAERYYSWEYDETRGGEYRTFTQKVVPVGN